MHGAALITVLIGLLQTLGHKPSRHPSYCTEALPRIQHAYEYDSLLFSPLLAKASRICCPECDGHDDGAHTSSRHFKWCRRTPHTRCSDGGRREHVAHIRPRDGCDDGDECRRSAVYHEWMGRGHDHRWQSELYFCSTKEFKTVSFLLHLLPKHIATCSSTLFVVVVIAIVRLGVGQLNHFYSQMQMAQPLFM